MNRQKESARQREGNDDVRHISEPVHPELVGGLRPMTRSAAGLSRSGFARTKRPELSRAVLSCHALRVRPPALRANHCGMHGTEPATAAMQPSWLSRDGRKRDARATPQNLRQA
jgi:hypothetical protein